MPQIESEGGEEAGIKKEGETADRTVDAVVDVGGEMTLPGRWPGRFITAELLLQRN